MLYQFPDSLAKSGFQTKYHQYARINGTAVTTEMAILFLYSNFRLNTNGKRIIRYIPAGIFDKRASELKKAYNKSRKYF